LLLRVSI